MYKEMGKQDRRSLPGVRESFLWEGETSLSEVREGVWWT